MRKCSILISIILISSCVKAQYNDIKIGATTSGWNLNYKRTFNKNIAAAIGFDAGRFAYATQSGYGIDGTEVTFQRIAYSITGDFRAYPLKKHDAPKGFFAGIHIRDIIIKETEPDLNVTNNLFNTGLNVGYQWIWGNFTMEVLGGYGLIKVLNVDSNRNLLEPENQDDIDNLGRIRIEFCIGIVFPKFKKSD